MKVASEFYQVAIDHLVKRGDTDIFPRPFELRFIEERRDAVLDALVALDLTNYHPMTVVESLIPKTKFGFRVAHQAYPVDTVVYTALVLSIYDAVEAGRDAKEEMRAFSYRRDPQNADGLFLPKRTYRDWMSHIMGMAFSDKYASVIRTDISDYYARVYRHRLENILQSLSGSEAVVKKIERIIADWRGGQSFGLPVGSDASRLLAEAALNDTDMALIAEGVLHTRYVDDFVIFVEKEKDPYAVLAFLAKHLAENEGLSLNNQKTRILSWNEFMATLDMPAAEDDQSKEEFATEKLFWAAYGNDEVDEKAMDALMLKDLSKELEELLAEPHWDMGKIRIVLHAMRLVQNSDVAKYVRANLASLIPFAKDVFLLIEEFFNKGIMGFEDMTQEIKRLLLSPRMQPLDCSRAWFLELGVRKIVSFSASEIKELDSLTGTLDVRQMHLLRWRAKDVNWFRSRKARVNEIHAWAQPSFIFGASCLPKDEYAHWIRSIKSRLQFPLGILFADWCLSKWGSEQI